MDDSYGRMGPSCRCYVDDFDTAANGTGELSITATAPDYEEARREQIALAMAQAMAAGAPKEEIEIRDHVDDRRDWPKSRQPSRAHQASRQFERQMQARPIERRRARPGLKV